MPRFALDEQIAAQPAAVADVLARVGAPALDPERPILFAGIGTSLHACRVAAAWTAELSGGAVRPHALEAHRLALHGPLTADDQLVVVSHRGTKRFPGALLERAREAGAASVAVTGFGAAEVAADHVLRTCADERSPTHTVSYLSALAALGRLVAASLGAAGAPLAEALEAVPGLLEATLAEPAPTAPAERLAAASPVLVAGFGLDAVTADEAALKLKEGAYMWAEGMSLEAALHGPVAVYAPPAAAVVISPAAEDGGRAGELRALLAELGLPVLACGPEARAELRFAAGPALVRPMLSILPLQRLVAELARRRGSNPDSIRADEEPWASAMARVKL